MISNDDILKSNFVFITVGSTQFVDLINEIDNENFLEIVENLGFNGVAVQYGTGSPPDNLISLINNNNDGNFLIECFSKKPSIDQYVQKAALVISHGGSGTILECLRSKKKLIVVNNETLMHNHQTQLASKLENKNYLVFTTCSNLFQSIQDKQWDSLTLFPEINLNSNPFLDLMNSHFGLE
eukprot:TRINITY_DN408_c0_g1_i2.p1 TRINITY_DN408_c0_g1~~TRINITY_DN408_c0_g1_i2.p1  ORF type:complete len:182 (-),score=39.99 TRINITY_DN408_c0_g1_i2:69-614(-)